MHGCTLSFLKQPQISSLHWKVKETEPGKILGLKSNYNSVQDSLMSFMYLYLIEAVAWVFLERDKVESCSQFTKKHWQAENDIPQSQTVLPKTPNPSLDTTHVDFQRCIHETVHPDWDVEFHSHHCREKKTKQNTKTGQVTAWKEKPSAPSLICISVNLVLVRPTCWFKREIINCELHRLAHQNAWLRHRLPALCCNWKYTHRGIMAVALKTYVKGAERKHQISSPDLTGMTTICGDEFHSFLAPCNLCLAECTQHMC